jgi:insertion element IS1 protein InsB
VNPYFTPGLDGTSSAGIEVEIRTDAEADELWSYVGNKKKQRWTWYAIERNTGVILAWHNGRRTDESCSLLMEKLSVFPVTRYYTDDWQSYRKYIPSSKHIIGKADTWRIERRNLNFRTHIKRLNRKTICFSKDEKIHDNVIGMYINRYYFEKGRYSESA